MVHSVEMTDDTLTFELSDGRTISAPLVWFPRLLHGTPEERNKWELIGRGIGIHWPELDEDISVENLPSRPTVRRKPKIPPALARSSHSARAG